MPNWVYNSVSIKGDENKLGTIRQFLSKENFMTEGEDYEFNFANLISIPEDKLEEYKETHGFGPEGETGNTEYNWYNWNIKNWGTKWNACEEVVQQDGDYLDYTFETPWSPPEGVIRALAEHSRQWGVSFVWSFEEEQGWGGEYDFDGESLRLVSEYDIPDSHAEYEARGKDCACLDYEPVFDDCPKAVE